MHQLYQMNRYFNSRPHKEVDLDFAVDCNSGWWFQFTTSQGGRPIRWPEMNWKKHFNSRPHKEVDSRKANEWFGKETFQFTTSQGGRLGISSISSITISFQFTTSQGGRPGGRGADDCWHVISIHDLTRRSTLSEDQDGQMILFQFTTSQGGRHCVFQ